MSSTYAYTALSPDYADLAQPQQDGQSALSPTTGRGFLGPGRRTRVSNVVEVLTSIYQRNVGLLLVIASQMFFSLMNVAVKKLNSIDPPVSALEVRWHHPNCPCTLVDDLRCIAYSGADGALTLYSIRFWLTPTASPRVSHTSVL